MVGVRSWIQVALFLILCGLTMGVARFPTWPGSPPLYVLPDLEPEVVPSYKDEPSRRRCRKEFAARHIQMMAIGIVLQLQF